MLLASTKCMGQTYQVLTKMRDFVWNQCLIIKLKAEWLIIICQWYMHRVIMWRRSLPTHLQVCSKTATYNIVQL